jgi:hypothetical protein
VFELDGLLINAFGAVFDYGLVDVVVVRWLSHGDTTRTYVFHLLRQTHSATQRPLAFKAQHH